MQYRMASESGESQSRMGRSDSNFPVWSTTLVGSHSRPWSWSLAASSPCFSSSDDSRGMFIKPRISEVENGGNTPPCNNACRVRRLPRLRRSAKLKNAPYYVAVGRARTTRDIMRRSDGKQARPTSYGMRFLPLDDGIHPLLKSKTKVFFLSFSSLAIIGTSDQICHRARSLSTWVQYQ